MGKPCDFIGAGCNDYRRWLYHGGTSQATPHVAGAIALLRANSVSPTESIDQTISRLKATGKPITDSRTGLVFPRIDLLATNGLTVN